MPRIDKLQPGSFVELDFNGKYQEFAVFLGISGEGDKRYAKFAQPQARGDQMFEWEAYRFNGGWKFGSSAERLSLVRVLS